MTKRSRHRVIFFNRVVYLCIIFMIIISCVAVKCYAIIAGCIFFFLFLFSSGRRENALEFLLPASPALLSVAAGLATGRDPGRSASPRTPGRRIVGPPREQSRVKYLNIISPGPPKSVFDVTIYEVRQ